MTDIRAISRLLVVLAVVLPAVLFLTNAADPVNVVKLTALALCALALLATGAVHAVLARRIALPWGLPGAVILALLLAFVLVAVASPATTVAVLGAYGRNSGLLSYVAALVVLVAVLTAFSRDSTRAVL